MAYSCSDFTDDILNELSIVVPEDDHDNPAAQAQMAINVIQDLRAENQTLRMQLECVKRDVRMIATRIGAMLKD